MSFKYIVANRSRMPSRVLFIKDCQIEGALQRPKGITVYSKRPYRQVKAVLYSLPGAIRMRLEAAMTSNLVKYLARVRR